MGQTSNPRHGTYGRFKNKWWLWPFILIFIFLVKSCSKLIFSNFNMTNALYNKIGWTKQVWSVHTKCYTNQSLQCFHHGRTRNIFCLSIINYASQQCIQFWICTSSTLFENWKESQKNITKIYILLLKKAQSRIQRVVPSDSSISNRSINIELKKTVGPLEQPNPTIIIKINSNLETRHAF